MQQEKFEQWALVELMGRQRIAGMVTERVIAGTGFMQVAVPETKANPPFTRLIHPNSLYAINPITEDVARAYAENLQVKPIDVWDLSAFMKKAEERRLELQAQQTDDDERGRAVYDEDQD
jgi:hypothetical protein